MLTSDESQQRNGRTAGSLGDAQLLFDKATAKVVIAEDSLMKCSEAFDIHLIRFTCFLFFSCTHDIVDCCTSMCGYMCLHGSSMFFMSVSSWSTLNCPPKTSQNYLSLRRLRCPSWKASRSCPRRTRKCTCRMPCMSMHVDACLWSMLYLNVFGRLSWVILVDLWIFRSLSGRSWRSLCQHCEPVTWPSRRRWQQKVRPWRFSGAKSPRQALAVAHLEYLDIFRIIIELFRIFRYIWHIIKKQLIILAWWIWMNMTYRYI